MAKFPDLPLYQGMNAPIRLEFDVHDLEVEGDIPDDLDGAFHRVAPDKQFAPYAELHMPFNGDGMVSLFRIKNGRADLKTRYVKTERLELEREADRSLFGGYRNPFSDDPSVAGKNRGLANTSTMIHNGTLLAMKEDSAPYALDPLTLETRGLYDFEGGLETNVFTSHPKIDPETGQMIAFAFGARGLLGRETIYYEIDREGRVTHTVEFEVPYYCMLHDFGVTRDYAVFPVIPITSDLERLKAGGSHFAWDGTRDIHLGVLPRGGEASDIRWFTMPNRFASHVVNAFNEGTKVHIDVPVATGNMFPFFPDASGAPFDPARAVSHVTRWTVDMASTDEGFAGEEKLTDFFGEYPRIDDRYAMNAHRHAWLLGMKQPRPTFAHLDLATGVTKTWTEPGNTSVQEPCFAPRSATSPEGDGYIVQLANRNDERRTDLLIYDALHIEEGPLATVKLPARLRNGYHGAWTPAAQLPNPAPA